MNPFELRFKVDTYKVEKVTKVKKEDLTMIGKIGKSKYVMKFQEN